jgi:two-component system, response regulator, stage 0 sporulation protein F
MRTMASPAFKPAPTALVVDDEPSIRLLLDRVLQRAGYKVTLAADGNEAVDFLRHGVFDVVLTDKNMPGLDGVDVARFARQALPDCCIVLITGYANPQSAEDSNGVVDAYLTKPFKITELEMEIAALRDRRRSYAVRRADLPSEEPPPRPGVALLLSRQSDREHLGSVLERTGYSVKRLPDSAAIATLAADTVLFLDDESCSTEAYRAVWLRQARDSSFRVVLLSAPDHPHAAINAVSLGASARVTRHSDDASIARAVEAAQQAHRSPRP